MRILKVVCMIWKSYTSLAAGNKNTAIPYVALHTKLLDNQKRNTTIHEKSPTQEPVLLKVSLTDAHERHHQFSIMTQMQVTKIPQVSEQSGTPRHHGSENGWCREPEMTEWGMWAFRATEHLKHLAESNTPHDPASFDNFPYLARPVGNDKHVLLSHHIRDNSIAPLILGAHTNMHGHARSFREHLQLPWHLHCQQQVWACDSFA